MKKFIGFSLLDGLFFAFYAAFVGYITKYMLECGLNNSVLSIVLAGFMAMSFIGALFWGGQCDRLHSNKKIFIPEFIGVVLISTFVYFMAPKNIWITACVYPFLGFLIAPLGSNLDSWMLRSFHGNANIYGRARSLGSVGYAVAMLVCGQLINRFGFQVIIISSGIIAAIVFFLAFTMGEEPFVSSSSAPKQKVNRFELFKIKPYFFMVCVLFLIGISVSPINNLKIVILESVGGGVDSLGMDAFIGVMIQAVFIFISGKLRRIPPYFRLLLSSICTFITTILTFLAISPIMVMLGTVVNNISFGIMLPTSREIAEMSVSEEMRNTAFSLSDAMFGSFSGIFALMYSGFLMDTFGAKSVALLGAIIMIIPLCMTSYTLYKARVKVVVK